MLTVLDSLAEDSRFLQSYRRLTTFQAWRTHLDGRVSSDSLEFFLEAQNDALASHVSARLGSWRQALKSLRSFIENVCFFLYYKDHPVELELWVQGRHRLGFASLFDYRERHPAIASPKSMVSGLQIVRKEYAVLSRAVHATGTGFRMTSGAQGTRLWSDDVARLGSWTTREKRCIEGINLLLMNCFSDMLKGAAHRQLRQSIGLAVSKNRRVAVKKELQIKLLD